MGSLQSPILKRVFLMERKSYGPHFNSISTTKGFPQLQIASITDEGFIKAFPIDGLAYETFPKLQFKRYSKIQNTNNNGLTCHL